jgi:hypothetical protein
MHTPEYSGLKGAQPRLAPGRCWRKRSRMSPDAAPTFENRPSLGLQRLFQLKDVLMQIEIYALAHERHAFHP